jgi:hypothetical protein
VRLRRALQREPDVPIRLDVTVEDEARHAGVVAEALEQRGDAGEEDRIQILLVRVQDQARSD